MPGGRERQREESVKRSANETQGQILRGANKRDPVTSEMRSTYSLSFDSQAKTQPATQSCTHTQAILIRHFQLEHHDADR